MLYLLIGLWLLGALIVWALVAIGGEPLPPRGAAGRSLDAAGAPSTARVGGRAARRGRRPAAVAAASARR